MNEKKAPKPGDLEFFQQALSQPVEDHRPNKRELNTIQEVFDNASLALREASKNMLCLFYQEQYGRSSFRAYQMSIAKFRARSLLNNQVYGDPIVPVLRYSLVYEGYPIPYAWADPVLIGHDYEHTPSEDSCPGFLYGELDQATILAHILSTPIVRNLIEEALKEQQEWDDMIVKHVAKTWPTSSS